MSSYTPLEAEILDKLGEAWNLFVKLPRSPETHPDDNSDFVWGIHHAQRIIMCRLARRMDPERHINHRIPPPENIVTSNNKIDVRFAKPTGPSPYDCSKPARLPYKDKDENA